MSQLESSQRAHEAALRLIGDFVADAMEVIETFPHAWRSCMRERGIEGPHFGVPERSELLDALVTLGLEDVEPGGEEICARLEQGFEVRR